jgi:hypothetical protein
MTRDAREAREKPNLLLISCLLQLPIPLGADHLFTLDEHLLR